MLSFMIYTIIIMKRWKLGTLLERLSALISWCLQCSWRLNTKVLTLQISIKWFLTGLCLIKHEYDAHSSTVLHIFRSGSSKPNGSELCGDPQHKVWPHSTPGKGGKNHCGTTTASHCTTSHTSLSSNLIRGLNLLNQYVTPQRHHNLAKIVLKYKLPIQFHQLMRYE